MSRAPTFHIIFHRFLSSKVLAFWRRAISSNFGCRHVPGEGVTAAGCDAWLVGVEGAFEGAFEGTVVDSMALN